MTAGHAVTFEVLAIGAGGEVTLNRVRSTDARLAAEQVRLEGLRVIACNPRATAQPLAFHWKLARPARIDVALFAEELAALLDAGLGMVDAMTTLAAKEREAGGRAALNTVVDRLIEGRSLSQAMQAQPEVFPALLVAAIAASEETGALVPSLRRHAQHLETLRALRAKVVGAAVYPLLLLGVGFIVVLFLLGVVVPRFATLLEGAHRELPAASALLLAMGRLIADHPLPFVGTVVTVAVLVGLQLRRMSREGWQMRGLQRLWLVGPLVRMFRHAQFYRTSALLVEGGIPALRAFTMSRSLLTPEDRVGLDAACARIAEGKSIGPALQQAQVADPVAVRMLEVAQRTGRLGEVLARIAQFQEATLARSIEMATRLVEPALMIFIGLVIGSIVVLMYLPIFELASSFQ
jgi:general secretion pathway protein F